MSVLRSKPRSDPLDLRSKPAAALWRRHTAPVQLGCRLSVRESGKLGKDRAQRLGTLKAPQGYPRWLERWLAGSDLLIRYSWLR